MHNRVTLIGNLTKDVELKTTDNGTMIANFGLAVNRKWKDRNTDEQREEVMFIDITAFGKTAELAGQYLAKGRKVFIEGRLQQDRWTSENGENHSRHIVIAETIEYLDAPKEEGAKETQKKSKK